MSLSLEVAEEKRPLGTLNNLQNMLLVILFTLWIRTFQNFGVGIIHSFVHIKPTSKTWPTFHSVHNTRCILCQKTAADFEINKNAR
jgi:hypothetical protein